MQKVKIIEVILYLNKFIVSDFPAKKIAQFKFRVLEII